jgi:hypothetical protein
MFASRQIATCAALVALLGLAACGGMVAADAPALMTRQEIAARAASVPDPSVGVAAANTLQWRAARLRARAAEIRRAGIHDGERSDLLRRAETLKSR